MECAYYFDFCRLCHAGRFDSCQALRFVPGAYCAGAYCAGAYCAGAYGAGAYGAGAYGAGAYGGWARFRSSSP